MVTHLPVAIALLPAGRPEGERVGIPVLITWGVVVEEDRLQLSQVITVVAVVIEPDCDVKKVLVTRPHVSLIPLPDAMA